MILPWHPLRVIFLSSGLPHPRHIYWPCHQSYLQWLFLEWRYGEGRNAQVPQTQPGQYQPFSCLLPRCNAHDKGFVLLPGKVTLPVGIPAWWGDGALPALPSGMQDGAVALCSH